jgi:hypothetical protein
MIYDTGFKRLEMVRLGVKSLRKSADGIDDCYN